MAKLDERIGFVGGGNMAFAIGSGLINRGIIKSSQIFVSGPRLENLQKWRDLGVTTTKANGEVVTNCDIIFICVKPHLLEEAVDQIRSGMPLAAMDKEKLFVSVLAGCKLDKLESQFSFLSKVKVIRSMPNTPMQVGEGCTSYAPGTYVSQTDMDKVQLLLGSVGVAQQVPEKLMDAAGALAGCGPAFVFTIIEALADGGVKQGLPRAMAIQFAAQTVLGAAKTVLESGKHPAVLRDEVCSPGGSTICGVHELERGGLRNTLINAVEKSTEKNARLG